ncbi:protein argonaute-2-like [Venturia canescens]|uniref:protein argonaute-2-like n=1 Tax=Venturia canescens TaxID=32260 RepID=UPI001C9C5CE5|nr:protein argonaute-2-like [Venturia canescens]
MGKKGKKKGNNEPDSGKAEAGSSTQQQQPQPAQQQQQQRQPQQQQQQQRQPQQQQQQQRQPQQQQQQQQQHQPQQQQQQRQPQQYQQQQQRQPQHQQQQQQRQPQQQQQPQWSAPSVAQITADVAQLNVGDGGRQNAGQGRGRGGRSGEQPRGAWGQGQGRAEQRESAPAHIPGMAQPPQGHGRGRGGRRDQPRPGGQQQPAQIPGMAQPPQQSYQRGDGDGKQAYRQRDPSAVSSIGDTASVKSGSSEGKDKGKKPGATQPAPRVSPAKTTLSATLQANYYNQIPKRKVPNRGGKEGRPITVETNMMPIIFKPNFARTVIHYDVKLDPDKPKFMYRAVVEAVRMNHYRNLYPAFDGRCNLFSTGVLPFGDNLTTEVVVLNKERQKDMTFKVSLTRAQDIDMSWLPQVRPGFAENERSQIAIQALDVILRSAAIRQNCTTVGRSFFSAPTGRVVELGNGMDLWVGTFQSAVLGWKPYFNVDVAHKAFPRSQRVTDLFQEMCGDPRSNQPVTPRDIEYNRHKLASFLKGLKVTYEIPGHPTSRRTMGVNDLGRDARSANFELDDGTVTTVENYFAKVKKYRIQQPLFPTLWVGSRNKTILIPAELCVIEPGQVTQKKMDERQTSTMIKYAATDAQTRKRKIMEGFAKMRTNEDPAMREFGVSIGGEFEKVNARVLNPPTLKGKGDMIVRKGVWRASGFFTPVTLPSKSWTILNLNDRTREDSLRNMVGCLMNGGRAVGMSIEEPLTPFKNMRAPMRDVREIIQFFNDKKEDGLKLIIVVVPDKTGPVYSKVKQVAELNVGILTQCIKAVTVERKMNDATAGNILLKINSKLNGTNQIFAPGKRPPCLAEPCMIVGADVTHPSPDAVGIPSIAAVAASHDPNAFRYNIKIQLQPPKTEIILNLEQIVKEQLLFFFKATGHKPAHIIFYRDGVSEGQFPQVMHHELQAIRNACKKLGGASTYEPHITFLVVQKRHHIRLFPTDPRNSDDRNGNVQAGTVVDTDITHPSHIDFYLVSHASIQGTARPTKYRCLWDDRGMSEDEIEQLTYYLCHMFSRCTRSVSYPAPTYYAHLAAFRARALINEVDIRLNNLEEEQRMKMTIKDDIIVKNPMFFV